MNKILLENVYAERSREQVIALRFVHTSSYHVYEFSTIYGLNQATKELKKQGVLQAEITAVVKDMFHSVEDLKRKLKRGDIG